MNLLILQRLHKGSARNNLSDFFLAVIKSNWSPSSKYAVSKGAHKPNLAKIQIKLVLLTNKLTCLYHKVVFKNWKYWQNKSTGNIFLNFFLPDFFCHIWI